MSQALLIVASGSGLAVRTDLNAALDRLATGASGTARPADIATGELWIETDNPGAGIWSVWKWDGSADVLTALWDSGAHTYTPIMPTQAPGNNTTRGASTAFVTAAIAALDLDLAGFASVLSAGTAPHATPTKVPFSSEQFDSDGKFDVSNARWTPSAGRYTIHASLVWGTSGVDVYEKLVIYKNGAALPGFSSSDNYIATAAERTDNISGVILANGTDYYELFTIQANVNSGAIGITHATFGALGK
jgi:hypothetical protein